MSTFLSDAKNYYNDFFEQDAWSDELADKTLEGMKDKNKRKECIKQTYELILGDTTIDEIVKFWVRKNYSIMDTAIRCGVSKNKIKNDTYYINKTLGKELAYDNENILSLCLKRVEITKYDWDAINKILQSVIIKRRSKAEKIGRLLDNRSLLINIPRKEYTTEIDENEFNIFLKLIQPYFINERKRTQQDINENHLRAAGYLNYIMTPGIELSDKDKRRLEKVKGLLDNQTLKDYKKLSKEKLVSIKDIEEDSEPIQEVKKTTKDADNKPVEYKTHRVQWNFK